jgi:hypothetical protein
MRISRISMLEKECLPNSFEAIQRELCDKFGAAFVPPFGLDSQMCVEMRA